MRGGADDLHAAVVCAVVRARTLRANGAQKWEVIRTHGCKVCAFPPALGHTVPSTRAQPLNSSTGGACLKGGQEAVVDIDGVPPVLLAELGGEDLQQQGGGMGRKQQQQPYQNSQHGCQ